MEQFSLEKWLQDKSRKVVTRDGREVRIVCWDLPGEYKIIGITDESDEGYTVINKKTDGTGVESASNLFFADEEEGLTEFEKELQTIISEASYWTSDDGSISTCCHFGDKEIKKISGQTLDLARKELNLVDNTCGEYALNEAYKQGKQDALKDLPKWKKCVGSTGPFIDDFRGEDYLYLKDYVIKVSELFEKLPKEE